MADFLTTSGISYHLERIIVNSKKQLILVSPYLHVSKKLYESLKDASYRYVNIKFIFGKDELKSESKDLLFDLKNIELFFFENLHAKCYFNESEMIITSMNMYQFSEKNNREMGIFITKAKDFEIFENAKEETFSILESSQHRKLFETNKNSSNPYKNNKTAFCIRCKNSIVYSLGDPYCSSCFSIWNQFENPFYQENFCHSCGKSDNSTMTKPLCYNCYSKYY